MSPLSSRRDCSRILALASLELDAAASALEQRRIARHRRRCSECDAAIAQMADVTARVRSAPPAPPPVLVAVAPFRPRRRVAMPALAAAVAVAAVAGVGGLISSADHGHTGAERRAQQASSRIATDQRLVIELQQSRSGRQLSAGPPSSYQLDH